MVAIVFGDLSGRPPSATKAPIVQTLPPGFLLSGGSSIRLDWFHQSPPRSQHWIHVVGVVSAVAASTALAVVSKIPTHRINKGPPVTSLLLGSASRDEVDQLQYQGCHFIDYRRTIKKKFGWLYNIVNFRGISEWDTLKTAKRTLRALVCHTGGELRKRSESPG